MASGLFDSLTGFVSSPPAQAVAGGALFGIVTKFFDKVEEKLTDKAKLEIAVWLLDAKAAPMIQNWPEAFLRMLDRVFSANQISLRSFRRSCFATYTTFVLVGIFSLNLPQVRSTLASMIPNETRHMHWLTMLAATIISIVICGFACVIPDYLSLLKTRYAVKQFVHHVSPTSRILIILGDVLGSLFFAASSVVLLDVLIWFGTRSTISSMPSPPQELKLGLSAFLLHESQEMLTGSGILMPSGSAILTLVLVGYPAFLGMIWLLLYSASGSLLRSARRFDIGIDWMNRRIDTEKRALSTIGLVAGALCAVLFWTAAIISRFV